MLEHHLSQLLLDERGNTVDFERKFRKHSKRLLQVFGDRVIKVDTTHGSIETVDSMLINLFEGGASNV